MASRRPNLKYCLERGGDVVAALSDANSTSASSVDVALSRDSTLRVSVNEWVISTLTWEQRRARLASRDLECAVDGLIALVGAAGALATAVADQNGLSDVWLHPDALVNLAWNVPREAAEQSEFLSRGVFWPCEDGSALSIVAPGDAEHRLVRAALREVAPNVMDTRTPLPMSARVAAELFQMWGIAALPARVTSRSKALHHGMPPHALRKMSLFSTSGETSAAMFELPAPSHPEKVVVLGQLVAAPYAGTLLSGLGHDVVHVHHPLRSPLSLLGPLPQIAIDVRSPNGRSAMSELLASSHIVIDNFRPRVMAQLGLDAIARNRGLKRISLPAFSSRTKYSNWRAYGFQLEALTGLGLTPSRLSHPLQRPTGTPLVSDFVSSFVAATAALTSARAFHELPQVASLEYWRDACVHNKHGRAA